MMNLSQHSTDADDADAFEGFPPPGSAASAEEPVIAESPAPPARKRGGRWVLGCAAIAGILLIGGGVVVIGGITIVGALGAGAVYAVSLDSPAPMPSLPDPDEIEANRAGLDAGGQVDDPHAPPDLPIEPVEVDVMEEGPGEAGDVSAPAATVHPAPRSARPPAPLRSEPRVAAAPASSSSATPTARETAVVPSPGGAADGATRSPSSDDTASVTVAGASSARLVRGDASYTLPAQVPPGRYALIVTFPGEEPVEVATVRTRKGAAVQVRCNAAMGLCRVQ